MASRLLGLCALAFAAVATPAQAAEVTVYAAASLTNALQEVGEAFAKTTGDRAKFSFAASSTLARQIEAGATASLFVSADEAWMDYLDKKNLLEPGSRMSLLGNRLVLVVPADRPLQVDIKPGGDWLSALPAGRIATGDPAHVPVGKYAAQAFTKLGVWDKVEPRLARADNVRNALVLVERGEAAAGVVYATDAAISKSVKVAGVFPEGTHDAISYPFALLAGKASPEARTLFDFAKGPEAKAIFIRHGFSVR
jgi:molybdate transport system substrate-binding protein